jgi:hypothetical protein
MAGALEEGAFRSLLEETGFEAIDIEPTRVYRVDDAEKWLKGAGLEQEFLARQLDGCLMGAFIRARKPLVVG